MLAAGTTFLTVRYPIDRVRSAMFWATGSVYGTNWPNVRVLALSLLVLTPCAIALTWSLRALRLGDDAARGLGLPLERTRLALIVVGCAPLGRRRRGRRADRLRRADGAAHRPDAGRAAHRQRDALHRRCSARSSCCSADMIAQHFLPVGLPVGVVTSAVGAPYFLFLLYRSSVRM